MESGPSLTLVKREKSRVQFAELDVGSDIAKAASTSNTKHDASFGPSTSARSINNKPRLRADQALDKSTLSKRHSRRRKLWKKIVTRR